MKIEMNVDVALLRDQKECIVDIMDTPAGQNRKERLEGILSLLGYVHDQVSPPELTRKQMEQALVKDVENWDLDNLIGYVQERIEEGFEISTDEDIRTEYDACIVGVYDG